MNVISEFESMLEGTPDNMIKDAIDFLIPSDDGMRSIYTGDEIEYFFEKTYSNDIEKFFENSSDATFDYSNYNISLRLFKGNISHIFESCAAYILKWCMLNPLSLNLEIINNRESLYKKLMEIKRKLINKRCDNNMHGNYEFSEALRKATVFDELTNNVNILINDLSEIRQRIANNDDKIDKCLIDLNNNINKKLDKCLDIDTRMEDKYLKEDSTPIGAKTYIEIICPNCGDVDKLWYDEDNFNLKMLAIKCKRCKEEYVLNYNANTKTFS